MEYSGKLTETRLGSRSNFNLNSVHEQSHEGGRGSWTVNLDVQNVRTYGTITGLFLYLFGFASIVTVSVGDNQKSLYVNRKSFIKRVLYSTIENELDGKNVDKEGLAKKILLTMNDSYILTAQKTESIYNYVMDEVFEQK